MQNNIKQPLSARNKKITTASYLLITTFGRLIMHIIDPANNLQNLRIK